MEDFANGIRVLLDLKIIDLTKAQYITDQYLLKLAVLTSDDVTTLNDLKASQEKLDAASAELAKGT